MGLLQTIATDGAATVPRWLQVAAVHGRGTRSSPLGCCRVHRWSERTVILLVMQSLDNSITTYTRQGLFGRPSYTSEQGHGEPNPTFIPAGHEANALAAKHIGGMPGGTWGEMFNIPLTAHFIGGCADRRRRRTTASIDPYHRVYGYPGLSVVDGAAISANLGVNPSLTITAQAERAFSLWPNKGEADPRPELGEAYLRIDPVPPRSPVVPESAPGALRLRIAGITQGPASTAATEPAATASAAEAAVEAPATSSAG